MSYIVKDLKILNERDTFDLDKKKDTTSYEIREVTLGRLTGINSVALQLFALGRLIKILEATIKKLEYCK